MLAVRTQVGHVGRELQNSQSSKTIMVSMFSGLPAPPRRVHTRSCSYNLPPFALRSLGCADMVFFETLVLAGQPSVVL